METLMRSDFGNAKLKCLLAIKMTILLQEKMDICRLIKKFPAKEIFMHQKVTIRLYDICGSI